jgi:hypothetical protein
MHLDTGTGLHRIFLTGSPGTEPPRCDAHRQRVQASQDPISRGQDGVLLASYR